MTDAVFLSASDQPSEYIRAQEAAGKTMPAQPGLFGKEGFSFGDFLDIINPLQHIPIVSTIYRAITGDTIQPGARIAGDTLFGGPIGLVGGVIDAMVQESTGKDIGQQALAMVGIDVGPDKPAVPATAVAAASEPTQDTGGVSPAAQATAQQVAAQQVAARQAQPQSQAQSDLKMTVGRAPGAAAAQSKYRWAGSEPEPKQKEVGPDDAVVESTYDSQQLAQGLAEQQLASRRAVEQMLAAHQVEAAQTNSAPNSASPTQSNPVPANPVAAQPPRGNGQPDPAAIISAMAQGPRPGARSIATPSDAPQVGADGRVWFPAFPRGVAPTRAVGTTPVTQQSVAAKFGTAKASLPGAPAPASVPSSAAPLIDESVQAATSDWSERAAAGYQKYFAMQQQADRTRAADQYH
ncbi:hypothetical protein [Ferrovibrio xuzhouensis]|uniref:Uncharacterized protein n=1 Tax=Ferrovibrio xuzhouensis TaxID=1576914 RepID=A0ABV7VAE2_9PROT